MNPLLAQITTYSTANNTNFAGNTGTWKVHERRPFLLGLLLASYLLS
jgi:hypothetical protein